MTESLVCGAISGFMAGIAYIIGLIMGRRRVKTQVGQCSCGALLTHDEWLKHSCPRGIFVGEREPRAAVRGRK